ncbi:2-keto-4-pentenoate hydratase [Actinoplanes friuliensis DSM 7358]|uniref:2-keto-4-pentenoate hydratase n=1 Tax=Actinoplanes friuliensis DSM 7358 TaxID=1246995 RepID=U5VZ99_9ACTN|nr:2-keto-4-pentenoate hydratase [Actinoplanes friuliensis DSM 7358]
MGVGTAATWGVTRSSAGDYPVYFDERISDDKRDRVDIAEPAEALTFARVRNAGATQLILVRSYENGTVSGVPVPGQADPVKAFTALGYDALRAQAGKKEPVNFPATELTIPFEGHGHNIAMGTNYPEHGAETSIDSAFLFPKMVAPSVHTDDLPVGDGLLDYEVELGMVPLTDLHPGESPEYLGLVLTDDWSNRETLLKHVNVDDVASGDGFTSAKSEPGFLTVGSLFVIPADWQKFHRELQLELYVDDELRQRGTPAEQIWDAPEIFRQIFAAGGRRWDHFGTPVTVTDRPDTIPARTVIQTGTPEGVVMRRPSTSDKIAGGIAYVTSFGQNADTVVDSAVGVYIARAHEDQAYLQPGMKVITRADRLGLIETSIVPGSRATKQ